MRHARAEPGALRPAPQGAGGLKYLNDNVAFIGRRPAPQGAGGLKYLLEHDLHIGDIVPPRKGRVD